MKYKTQRQNKMFLLPKKIESLMATLAQLYERKENRLLQRVLVNAKIESVIEGVEHDNWDGGIDGHQIILTIPEAIFFEIFDNLSDVAEELCKDLNKVNTSINNEYFQSILLEKEEIERPNWRSDSGLLLQETHTVSNSAQKRIWKDDTFRLFISHKTEDKINISNLKAQLAKYGISCFVAHEDIEPTQQWADEIENALFSMDACVAIMTEKYHNSSWTDHEVGCAYGRHVPVIAVRMGKDPYGLIGRFQALSASWENLAEKLMAILIKYSAVKDAYIKSIAACNDYEQGNLLAKMLPYIKDLTDEQLDKLIDAWYNNGQVYHCYGFDGSHAYSYGPGICHYITQWSPTRFPDEDTIIKFAYKRKQQVMENSFTRKWK